MKQKKKRKKLIKFLILILIFLLILGAALAAAVLHRQTVKDESYQQMEKATLPVISLNYGNGYTTQLHGYVSEMTVKDMRDVIVPLDKERSLTIQLNDCGNHVDSLSYEIRSLNGSDFLDEGSIPEPVFVNGLFETRVRFSNLLESGQEYQLILKVGIQEKTVRYYTRIIYSRTEYSEELLDFVMTFSEATYDREKASFIVNYIQPEEKSDTTDYSYTDIHSKYTMFTFGNLEVLRNPELLLRITELEPTQMAVTLEYSIRIADGDKYSICDVREFFCVRYRSGKVYLLDYYRKLSQRFSVEEAVRERGRIQLGIGDGNVQIINSDNDNYTVFVTQKEIWSYNIRTNAMNRVFSFRDDEDPTGRSAFDHHNVQVVEVSDEGNIDYMVYGYMNRGTYEGQVGICFYRYNAEKNATDRLFYMPVSQSEQILMMDLGTLAYVNGQDVCYLRYGDGIYSIDLNSGENVEVSIRAYPGTYAKNSAGNVVAWQEGSDLLYPERLVILNMDSQTTSVVDAVEGEYVKILGFIGDDIVYGFGNRNDSVIQANIDMTQLLNRLIIASTDEEQTIQKDYQANGFLISDVDVFPTRIVIGRGTKNLQGQFLPMEEDVLLLSETISEKTEKSMLLSRNTEPKKKQYYIQIGKAVNADAQFSTVIPRFETKNAANVIALTHQQTGVYYVYGYGTLLHVESKINIAIDEAYDVMGVVVDDEMNTLWTRGTRDLFKTISIQPYRNTDTLCASLQVLCAQAGIQLKDVEGDLSSGKSPLAIIDDALGEGASLDLYGCSLQEAEYFVNAGHPVICVSGDRSAVVICGYETDSVSVYQPDTGETVSLSTKEAEEMFRENGNSFISYR